MCKSEYIGKGKGKVIPLQAYEAQRVLGRLRLPDSVTSALEGCQPYAPAVFTPRSIRLSRPRAHGIVRCHRKILQ
jgi:hypothetical protein